MTTYRGDDHDLAQLDERAAALTAALIHHPTIGAVLRRGASTDTLDRINRLAAGRPR